MKLQNAVKSLKKACKKTDQSKEYDVTLKFSTPKKNTDVVFRAAGNNTDKILKLTASALIVAGGAMIIRELKKFK